MFGGNIGDLSQSNSAAVGSLVLNGPGTLTLAGSNTYTGSTTVSSGVLQLGSSTALYAGSGIGNAIVNGTLDLNGNNASVGALSGAGIVLSSVSRASTLTAGFNNANSTYNGTIQNSVSGLTKTGSGILVLTAAEGAPNITISGGTLQIGNGGTTGSIPNAATVVDNGALVYNLGAAAATVPSGGITGSGIVSVTTAGNTHGGGLVILGNVTTGGSQSYDATVATHTRGTGVQIGGPGANAAAATYTLATTAAGASITLIGDIGQDAGSPLQNLVLSTSADNGTINLNISIGYAGDWYSLGAFTANAGTGAINWTGTYAAPAENQTTPISLTGAINFSSNFGCHTALPITFNPTGPSTLSGVISGPVAVTAAGPGTLTITLAESYTGSSTINGGVSTTISGGVLQLGTGIAGQDGSITGAGGVTDNAALVFDLAGSQTAAYGIVGSGSLTMMGSGMLTLSGTNTYTGGTTVSNGELIVASPTAIDANGIGTNLFVGNDLSAFGGVISADAAIPTGSAAAAVPEPGTLGLLAAATAVLVVRLRRKSRRS